MMRRIVISMCCLAVTAAMSQTLTDGLEQRYEIQCSASDGNTPLWLNANRYGLSSLRSFNGYARAAVERPLDADTLRTWGVGYGADVAVPLHYTSHLVIQQLYAALRYKHGVLTLGQRQQPMQLKNQRLSSGSQTLGINARPVPEVRIAVPEYYDLPGTHRWLALKGHCAYGWMTDASFQEDWTQQTSHYATGVRCHTKAGYLRIGPDDARHPYSLELGLEMACEFGGTMYHTNHGTVEGTTGLKGCWQAFCGTGSDEADATYHNVGGNQLGSWVARLNYEWPAVRASVYADHFFEDHSSMFLLDYDGYGEGADWNVRADNRYLRYALRDMMVGCELQLKHLPWLSAIVAEYLGTRYQSGPIYHDHNTGLSDHIGGDDNYYNHYLYQGWSHWGQVMGNPLYRSPLYNTDHTLTISDNRFRAWHVGLEGSCASVSYRMLLSWQKGYGTYQNPLLSPQHNLSVMAEATYHMADSSVLPHCAVRLALGLDNGQLLGDNMGAQLTFIYHLGAKQP